MALQQYDFMDINSLFRKQMEPLFPESDGSFRKVVITERDIKQVSLAFQKFIEVSVDPSDVGFFLESVIKYFCVIIKYSKQFENSESYKHYFVVRMALDVFLFVIDSLKIHSEIASKFVKVIDKIVDDFREDPCIKEFFRMYSVFLTKIPRALGTKHKSLHLFYQLAQNTSDIETQAIVIEVVLKLFNFNVGRVMEYNIFPEILDIAKLPSRIQENNLYETIRMILGALNRDSENIVSINCRKITVDKKAIVEFDGASSAHDIWLDIDMSQKILSFFCAKRLITSFTNTMFNTFTTWGVLSFRVEEVLKIEFVHNVPSNTLEILIKIKASSFNLFGDFKFDIVRTVGIIIPNQGDNFKKLLSSEIFTEFPETLTVKNIESQQNSDNELTEDDLSVVTTSSSPVISMSRRMKLSTISEGQEGSDGNVIIVLSDDEEETARTNNNVTKEADTSRDSRIKSNNEDPALEIPRYTSFMKKISMPDRNEEPLFEKSITPISFTESLVGRSKNAKRKVSVPIEKEETSPKKRSSQKISIPIEKINVVYEKKGPKISAAKQIALYQPVEPLSENSKIEEPPKQVNVSCEETMDYSTSKVEDWLKSISPEITVEDHENISPKASSSGQTQSDLGDLEGVTNWLENQKDSSKQPEHRLSGLSSVSQRSKASGRTESLLHLLEKEVNNVKTQKNAFVSPGETLNVNKEAEEISNEVQEFAKFDDVTPESLRSVSDVPLSKLAENWNAAKKTTGGPSQLSPDVISESPPDAITRKEEGITSPKDNLELSVAVDKAVGGIDKSVDTLHSTSDTSVFMDVVRDREETEDLVSHFPQLVVPEVTVVEFGSYSSDSTNSPGNVVIRKHIMKNVNKDLNPTRNAIKEKDTANNEIKEMDISKNVKNKEKEVQEKILSANESRTLDKSQNIDTAKRKRPLYTPGDYSYLSETIAEEYLPSETVLEPIVHVAKRRRGRPSKSPTKENKKTEEYQRRSSRSKRKEKSSCCPPKNTIATSGTSLTLDKAFESLKKKIKNEKKMGKLQKKIEEARKGRRNGVRVEVSSPSSPSSLEPFGKLVNKRKKGNETVDKLKNSKQLKQQKHNTVNIISDILIKPAASSLARSSPVPSQTEKTEEKTCFCQTYIRLLQHDFIKLLEHVQHCDLNIFNNKKLSAIDNLLQKL